MRGLSLTRQRRFTPKRLHAGLACRWHKLEADPKFEAGANYGIGGAYALIGLVALVSI